jgi:hypothetical protein
MFDLTIRGTIRVAVGLIAGAALAVFAAFAAADYIMNDLNDPLTKAGGLSPVQERAVEQE